MLKIRLEGIILNKEVQRKTILICIAMIVVGVGLFVNAAAKLSSTWNKEKENAVSSQTTSNTSASVMQEVISPGNQLDLTQSSEKIQYIQSHENLYPDELLDLLSRNVETVDFIYSYPNLEKAGLNTEAAAEGLVLTSEEMESSHPLLLQWDTRWGAIPYGNSMMALSGCGPTCLSMVAAGLTGNSEATPAAIAMFAMERGYYIEGTGTAWSLMTEGCTHYGLQGQEISLSEEVMAQKLQEGCKIGRAHV